MSDPRLEGDYYISYDSDDYESPTVTSVGTGAWRIENGEGAWQGSFTNIKYPDSTTIVSTALVGEGAYDGLTALWESTNHSLCSADLDRGLRTGNQMLGGRHDLTSLSQDPRSAPAVLDLYASRFSPIPRPR